MMARAGRRGTASVSFGRTHFSKHLLLRLVSSRMFCLVGSAMSCEAMCSGRGGGAELGDQRGRTGAGFERSCMHSLAFIERRWRRQRVWGVWGEKTGKVVFLGIVDDVGDVEGRAVRVTTGAPLVVR